MFTVSVPLHLSVCRTSRQLFFLLSLHFLVKLTYFCNILLYIIGLQLLYLQSVICDCILTFLVYALLLQLLYVLCNFLSACPVTTAASVPNLYVLHILNSIACCCALSMVLVAD